MENKKIQSKSYSYWFANNYESLVKLLAPCNLDILHDCFLACQKARGNYMKVTLATYQRLLQQEQNRSYQTFNPDPRFWQFLAETVINEEPAADPQLIYRRLLDFVKQNYAGDELEMLLLRLETGASLEGIACIMGKSMNQVTHFFRRFRNLYRSHFHQFLA